MFQYKRLTPDQLLAELAGHVAESVKAAERGDYDARQWLCECFPGHTSFFRRAWSSSEGVQCLKMPRKKL